jgi:hypothetical protein
MDRALVVPRVSVVDVVSVVAEVLAEVRAIEEASAGAELTRRGEAGNFMRCWSKT